MRALLFVVGVVSATAVSAAPASACPDGHEVRVPVQVPVAVPLSSLPALPPAREYVNPASGYYAPGPTIGVQPLPVVRPTYAPRPAYPYVYRPYGTRRVIIRR